MTQSPEKERSQQKQKHPNDLKKLEKIADPHAKILNKIDLNTISKYILLYGKKDEKLMMDDLSYRL